MVEKRHVGAVFEDRSSAEIAAAELRRRGLADEHLAVAIRRPDGYVFEEDIGKDVAGGVGKGVLVGAPLGAVAGAALMALVIAGSETVGVGGLLAGGWVGAVGGTYLGACVGLGSEEHVLEEEWDWERVRLEPGQVLIVVADHGHSTQVTGILEQHGGRLVAMPAHVA